MIDFDRINWEERPQAQRIAMWMNGRHRTARILDIGCGPGLYVEEMHRADLCALGVDHDPRLVESDHLRRVDLTQSTPDGFWDWVGEVDVALSLEVGEHIPEEQTEAYVDFIDGVNPRILYFSAARPGQGGEGHVNCQPKAYWVERLHHVGFWLNPDATDEWISWLRQGPHMGWLVQNGLIFSR
jgi:SAM-dependent methyltransferase